MNFSHLQVYVCEREIERKNVCANVQNKEREKKCVYVRVCVFNKENEENMRGWVCVVNVCVREGSMLIIYIGTHICVVTFL